MDNVEELYNQKIEFWYRNGGIHGTGYWAIYMVSRWNVVFTGIYAAKKNPDTDTDTSTLSRVAPGKRYTLRVHWPGFRGLIEKKNK